MRRLLPASSRVLSRARPAAPRRKSTIAPEPSAPPPPVAVLSHRPRLEALRRQLGDGTDDAPPLRPPPPPEVTSTAYPGRLSSVDGTIIGDPLTDTFGRRHTYLRISLVERCNLRCLYCMPPEGVSLQAQSNLMTDDEIVRAAAIFVRRGVDKIRLTGGEPLLRKNLADIVFRLADLGVRHIGMTTNGLVLKRKLPSLVAAGLTHINLSLDTMRDDRFLEITRRKGRATVVEAIRCAAEALPGTGRVKVNVVVMRNFNDDELRDFVAMADEFGVDVRFIEWMPFNSNGWNDGRFLSYADMLHLIRRDDGPAAELLGPGRQRLPPAILERADDGPNDTTKWYRTPIGRGRVGFITSMSEHFCGTCNRLRLTSDGRIKACLFGDDEVGLRDAMRAGATDGRLEELVAEAVTGKRAALGGHGDMYGIAAASDGNRSMTTIGG